MLMDFNFNTLDPISEMLRVLQNSNFNCLTLQINFEVNTHKSCASIHFSASRYIASIGVRSGNTSVCTLQWCKLILVC